MVLWLDFVICLWYVCSLLCTLLSLSLSVLIYVCQCLQSFFGYHWGHLHQSPHTAPSSHLVTFGGRHSPSALDRLLSWEEEEEQSGCPHQHPHTAPSSHLITFGGRHSPSALDRLLSWEEEEQLGRPHQSPHTAPSSHLVTFGGRHSPSALDRLLSWEEEEQLGRPRTQAPAHSTILRVAPRCGEDS